MDIYDQTKLLTFEVDVAPADLQLVDSDPAAEIFFKSSVKSVCEKATMPS